MQAYGDAWKWIPPYHSQASPQTSIADSSTLPLPLNLSVGIPPEFSMLKYAFSRRLFLSAVQPHPHPPPPVQARKKMLLLISDKIFLCLTFPKYDFSICILQ